MDLGNRSPGCAGHPAPETRHRLGLRGSRLGASAVGPWGSSRPPQATESRSPAGKACGDAREPPAVASLPEGGQPALQDTRASGSVRAAGGSTTTSLTGCADRQAPNSRAPSCACTRTRVPSCALMTPGDGNAQVGKDCPPALSPRQRPRAGRFRPRPPSQRLSVEVRTALSQPCPHPQSGGVRGGPYVKARSLKFPGRLRRGRDCGAITLSPSVF